jgi:hypothetical protein
MPARRLVGVAALVPAILAMAVSTASATGFASPELLPRAAARATGAGSITFGGFSSQNWPVVLALSPAGRISQVEIGLDMTCVSGTSFAAEAGFRDLPVARGGKIRATRSIPPETGSTASLSGGTESLRARINVHRATITGSWHLHLGFQMSNGQTDQCDSGNVTFTARL